MSEPENFLGRWSRRKRDAADEPPAEPQDAAKAAPARPQGDVQAAEVPFDPASLPPLDSIAADSDIRAFLKPGVPPELARAALRRAWSADPAIRDFVGLVENGWDFNNPDAMPGFGPISGADVANLLAQVVGAPQPAEPVVPQSTAAQQTLETPGEGLAQRLQQDGPAPAQVAAAPKEESVRRNEDIATQNDTDEKYSVPPTRQRGHGGALPK
jgi:uncharacterized protein DUF3306